MYTLSFDCDNLRNLWSGRSDLERLNFETSWSVQLTQYLPRGTFSAPLPPGHMGDRHQNARHIVWDWPPSVCRLSATSVQMFWRRCVPKNDRMIQTANWISPITIWIITIWMIINPLMGTLKPRSNGPLCSNTVIGTLAVDGWAVTFGTERMLLGGAIVRPGPSSLYQM